MTFSPSKLGGALALAVLAASVAVFWPAPRASAHGDVSPQPVNTEGLDKIPEWRKENPYRSSGGPQYELAKQIGSSGYNQNCARCHGLEVISGGIAPDIRFLEKGTEGDEWFMERIRKGYVLNGAYKMPSFESVLSQEAMWAIRSYIETRPRD
jgi:cytochrome c-550 PedF